MTSETDVSQNVREGLVGIFGAGPAGLVSARILSLSGISCVILESRSRTYCESRVRAGQLDRNSIEVLERIGAADRFARESMTHEGLLLRFRGVNHRVDFVEATGASTAIYGQQDLVRDLIELNLASGVPIVFEVSDVTIDGIESERPSIAYRDRDGAKQVLRCSVVAGCDGFHWASSIVHPQPANV
jgi:p-hydroxybenzoate 3-monooxygenase